MNCSHVKEGHTAEVPETTIHIKAPNVTVLFYILLYLLETHNSIF